MFQAEGFLMEKMLMIEIGITEEQENLKQKLMELSSTHVQMHMYNTFQYLVCARKTI